MKKIRIASLLLLAPLSLLAACATTPTLILEANWFNNTNTKIIPDDFEEILEYSISFEKSSTALKGSFKMDYPNGGTYTTTFKSGATADGKKTYVYTTELKTEVEYTLNGVSSGTMSEVVTTCVEFLDVASELKPLTSWREVHATAPRTTPSNPFATLQACYAKLDYKNEFVYDHDKGTVTFTQTDLTSDATKKEPTVSTIKIGGKGIYFDNEQLIPLLRAAELATSMSMRSVDTTTGTLDRMTIKDGPTAVTLKQSVKLKSDEKAEEREFAAYQINLAYNKQNSGGTHKFTLARPGNHDSNTYRNVCLKYEYPVIYSHGILTYTLTSADFY